MPGRYVTIPPSIHIGPKVLFFKDQNQKKEPTGRSHEIPSSLVSKKYALPTTDAGMSIVSTAAAVLKDGEEEVPIVALQVFGQKLKRRCREVAIEPKA